MTPPRRTKPKAAKSGDPVGPMSETAFQGWVIKQAIACGWKIYRQQRMMIGGVWRSGMNPRGWPDLTLIRPPQLGFLELKAVGGKPSDEQVETLAALNRCDGVSFARCVDPKDALEVLALLGIRRDQQ